MSGTQADSKLILYKKYADYLKMFVVHAIAAVLMLVVVLRAANTGITYDEAYTYINYARDLTLNAIPKIFQNSVANNHWLNTILINLVQRFSLSEFNEFLIRVPVIFSYFLYLYLLIFLVHKNKMRFWAFCLFALSFYVNEFFGLARGYGISVLLNTAALAMYREWRLNPGEGKQVYISLCFLLFSLSSASITVSLLVMAPIAAAALMKMMREKSLGQYLKTQWPFWVPSIIIVIIMLRYNSVISHAGNPLPPSAANLYDSFARGFVLMFMQDGNPARSIAAVGMAVFICLIALFFKKISRSVFVLPIIIHLLLWFVIYWKTNINYCPAGRVLLPSFPLMVYAIIEIAAWCNGYLSSQDNNKNVYRIIRPCVKFCIVSFLVICFYKNVSLISTKDWQDNYIVKYIAYSHFNNKSKLDDFPPHVTYTAIFYRYKYKILYEYGFDIGLEENIYEQNQ
jgi:hypothetical protein